MARVITCPHCYMSVIATAAGRCPACGKDTNDLTGTDPNLAEVVLTPGSALPPVCIVCGAEAGHTRRVVCSRPLEPGQDPDAGARMLGMMVLFGWLLGAILANYQKSNGQRLLIDLPVCGAHRRSKEALAPIHANFDLSQMTFVGHRAFREAIRRAAGG